MTEDDDRNVAPKSAEPKSQETPVSEKKQQVSSPAEDLQQSDGSNETVPAAPEESEATNTPPNVATSGIDGDQTGPHVPETQQQTPLEQADMPDVPAHDLPRHSVPPTTAPEGNIPPHEVPEHHVPPVNQQQQAVQAPATPDPEQMVEPNLVNRAVDVIASSSSQRDAVQRSFELQRATIAHGIKSRRDAAMEQAAAAKADIGQQHSIMPQQGATSMNQQYAPPPQPQAAPGQQYQAGPQPGIATHPGMAGYTGAAPLSNNEIIAQEFASTLRQIIAEEVDKQLKALLAAYTSAEAGTTESPVE